LRETPMTSTVSILFQKVGMTLHDQG
jgi:hypothetical protein